MSGRERSLCPRRCGTMTRISRLAFMTARPRDCRRHGRRQYAERSREAIGRMTGSLERGRACRARRIAERACARDRLLGPRVRALGGSVVRNGRLVAVCPAAVVFFCECGRLWTEGDAEKPGCESNRHPRAPHARAVSTDLAKDTGSTRPFPRHARAPCNACMHPSTECDESTKTMKISDPIDELTPMIRRTCDTMANTLSLFIKRLWFRGLAPLSSFAFVANRGAKPRLLFVLGYAVLESRCRPIPGSVMRVEK